MPTCSTNLVVGAWVDDAFASVTPDYAARFRAVGLTEAALMINTANDVRTAPGWELRAKAATIAKAAANLRAAGVSIILTCWPRPDRAQLAELEADMRALVDGIDPAAIEVDTEGNWERSLLRGFKSMDEAAAELVATLRRIAGGRRVELTTYPYHSENGPKALVAPHVDLLLPQAYSVHERAGNAVAWDDKLGPGKMQALTLGLAAKTGAPQTALTGCGLAAYEQRFAGHAPEEAMRVALQAARSNGAQRVRYWSSKWIVGAMSKRQPWAAATIRSEVGA